MSTSLKRSGGALPPLQKHKALKKRRGAGGGLHYGRYLLRLLKQIHPELSLSTKSAAVLNSMAQDIFERLAREAGQLARANKRRTLTAREVQSAVRLVLRGELAKHAVAEGTRALTKYQATVALG